jgi:tape measure domain-containing protein
MNKKIASLFASVGFNIDTTDLNKLDGHLKTIRGNTANLSRNLRVVNTQLNTTSTRMRNLAKAAEAVTKFNNLGGKYVTLAVKVKEAEGAIARFARVLKLIEPRLDSTNFRLSTTVRSYRDLAAAVREANRELSRTPNRPPRPIPPLGGGRGNGGGGSGGGQGGGAGAGFLGGLLGTLGRFTPTGLVGGSALTGAAVGVNEIRKAGQDQQRMENLLLFSTKSQEEYARSLEFVRKESLRLGLNSVELGKAFAQVNMSAREKLTEEQRRKMFTQASEYIMVTGAGQEDQKLIFKAVNQMFSLGRIMAEEMNQLTERGVPRQLIYDVAKEVYNVKSTADVLKLQKDGQLDPSKILPKVFERFAKQARDTGAFSKMQGSSIVSQNRFQESLRQAADDIMDSGLDKALATFFDILNGGLPYVVSFIKGLGGVIKGISEITKVVWSAVEGLGAFIGANSQLVLNFSVLLGIFAVLTARVTGATLVFGRLGLLLSTLGRRIPLIAMLLTLFYLFKEYDRYVKGEDSWMAGFADWMIYLAESTRLWKEELIGAFNAAKEFKFSSIAENTSASPLVPTRNFKGLVEKSILGFADLFSSDNTLPQRGNGLGEILPSSYGSQNPPPNNQQMLAAEVMLPVVIQDKLGNVTDRQNIPARVSIINTGGLLQG